MCVRKADDHCVLQFTLIHAAGCVLHRRTSRVIHRQELSNSWKLYLPLGRGYATVRSITDDGLRPRPVVSGAGAFGSRSCGACEITRSLRPAHDESRGPSGGGKVRWPHRAVVSLPVGRIQGLGPASRAPGIGRITGCKRVLDPRTPPRTGQEGDANHCARTSPGSPALDHSREHIRRRHWWGPARPNFPPGLGPISQEFQEWLRPAWHLHKRPWQAGSPGCGPRGSSVSLSSLMILPQVHLRKPCYDFYFL